MNIIMSAILDLIYPRACAGCGKWDTDLCSDCAHRYGPWRQVHEQLPYLCEVSTDDGADTSPFPVWALADYTGCVARSIVRWKNVRSRGLDRRFCEVICASQPPALGIIARNRLYVVPAPSRRARYRQAMFVAGQCAHVIADLYGGTYAPILRTRRRRRSTPRGLAVRGRTMRAMSAIHADIVSGADVVLVDDVVTSGATLAGAARVVSSCGGRVVGAFVLAAAHDPRNVGMKSYNGR